MAERKSRGSGASSEGAASDSSTTTGSAKRRRRRKAEVIDVGEKPSEEEVEGRDRDGRDGRDGEGSDGGNEGDAEESDDDGKAELVDGADVDMAAAAPLDVDDIADDDAAAPAVPGSSRGGSIAKRDPMAVYMRETRRYPLLTPEEEHALATRLVEHGDTKAARKLIEANLRLVVKIAYEYRRAHKNLLDLVQEGNIGLIQAVGKFDPYRGVKLSSYAAFWIRAYILKFILNNWRLVKIGTTQP